MELNCHSLLLLYANVLTEFNLTCKNIRECKKCAKASQKDLGAKQAAAAAGAANGHQFQTEHSSDDKSQKNHGLMEHLQQFPHLTRILAGQSLAGRRVWETLQTYRLNIL
jgi:hypothetical protein